MYFCLLSFSVDNLVSMCTIDIREPIPEVQPVNLLRHCGSHFRFGRHCIFHLPDMQ